jgi:hypothetical protein
LPESGRGDHAEVDGSESAHTRYLYRECRLVKN